jgi:hypothetical protein
MRRTLLPRPPVRIQGLMLRDVHIYLPFLEQKKEHWNIFIYSGEHYDPVCDSHIKISRAMKET